MNTRIKYFAALLSMSLAACVLIQGDGSSLVFGSNTPVSESQAVSFQEVIGFHLALRRFCQKHGLGVVFIGPISEYQVGRDIPEGNPWASSIGASLSWQLRVEDDWRHQIPEDVSHYFPKGENLAPASFTLFPNPELSDESVASCVIGQTRFFILARCADSDALLNSSLLPKLPKSMTFRRFLEDFAVSWKRQQ